MTAQQPLKRKASTTESPIAPIKRAKKRAAATPPAPSRQSRRLKQLEPEFTTTEQTTAATTAVDTTPITNAPIKPEPTKFAPLKSAKKARPAPKKTSGKKRKQEKSDLVEPAKKVQKTIAPKPVPVVEAETVLEVVAITEAEAIQEVSSITHEETRRPTAITTPDLANISQTNQEQEKSCASDATADKEPEEQLLEDAVRTSATPPALVDDGYDSAWGEASDGDEDSPVPDKMFESESNETVIEQMKIAFEKAKTIVATTAAPRSAIDADEYEVEIIYPSPKEESFPDLPPKDSQFEQLCPQEGHTGALDEDLAEHAPTDDEYDTDSGLFGDGRSFQEPLNSESQAHIESDSNDPIETIESPPKTHSNSPQSVLPPLSTRMSSLEPIGPGELTSLDPQQQTRSARVRVLQAVDLSLSDYLNANGREKLDEEAKQIIRITITEEEVDLASFVTSLDRSEAVPTGSLQANSNVVGDTSIPREPVADVASQVNPPHEEAKSKLDLPDLAPSPVSSPSAKKMLAGEKDKWCQAIFLDIDPGTGEKKVFKKSTTTKYGIKNVNIYDKSTIVKVEDTALDAVLVSETQATELDARHNASERIKSEPVDAVDDDASQLILQEGDIGSPDEDELESLARELDGGKAEESKATQDVVEKGDISEEKVSWATPEWYRKPSPEARPSEDENNFGLDEPLE